jgi:hypothetical protein
MISRRVRNLMTREVVTVNEAAPFTEMVRRKSLVPMAVHLTRTVPGVVDVVSRLTFELDDDRLEMPHSRSFLP